MDLSTSAATRSSVTAGGGVGFAADRVQRFEVGAAREHRHPREEQLLGLVQQPVGPVDRGGEALVAGLRGARGPGEQVAVVEPLGDLGGAHRPGARGGQFDAERQPVEPSADLGDDPGRPGRSRDGWPARAARRASRRPVAAAAAPARPARRRRRAAPGSWRARRPLGTARRGAGPAGRRRPARARSCPARAAASGWRSTRRPSPRSSWRAAAASAARRRRRGPRSRPRRAGPARRSRRRRRTGRAGGFATSIASRVLPTPPTPTSVTSGAVRSASATASIACSRPTSAVRRRGRLVGRSAAVGASVGSCSNTRRCSARVASDGSTPSSSTRRSRRAR